MKPFQLLSSALAFSLADAYLVTPPGTVAPGAISTCSEWVQASYGMTCDIIHRLFGMTDAEFELWNPSVTQLGDDCTLIRDLYYCVQVNYVTQTPTWSAPTPTTTSTTGVTTPTPTQTGMVSTCNDFYLVVSGDSCFDIAAANGIALDDLYSWNPAVGTDCAGLWPDYYICVGLIGGSTPTTTTTTTTTTTAGNGVATPTPIQTGMVTTCKTFYLVLSGDGCYDIAAAAGVTLDNFYAWNPAVGTDCAGLWPDYYVCVGV
ncbi:hypothetical protein N7535_004338 [Penicillium sp. DV-2018c]|nr:hypothetical protein N7461_007922 [Penicillium sp. DV-2018c]KAJ5570678.1 hypothetical protein N7535_004338 [Penicillium sp. DV-2018c]